MGIHDGHRERLRKRFLTQGLSGFEPVNVLELLLFFSHKRCDTNEIAHRLLDRFGSFSGVLDAPYEMLCQVEGVGPISACLIKLVAGCANYYANDKVKIDESINSTGLAGKYLVPRFIGSRNEEVYLLLLDDKHKVLRCTKLFEGTVNMVPILVRKVVGEVVAVNATVVILAHNHPGGLAIPSYEDKMATRKLAAILNDLNVRLIDHIVVADGDYVSMRDSGMLEGVN